MEGDVTNLDGQQGKICEKRNEFQILLLSLRTPGDLWMVKSTKWLEINV